MPQSQLTLLRVSPAFSRKAGVLLILAASFSLGLCASVVSGLYQPAAAQPAEKNLSMMEIEPELDTTGQSSSSSSGGASADEAVKAKAVVVDVNSKSLTYDQDRDVYIATGAVHVVISEQNSELFADQVIYDQNQSLLIAEGHVVIHKNGEKTVGTYAKIDLTRQSALINDIATSVDQVRIKAQQAMVANEYQVFENGRLILTKDMLSSAMGKKHNKGLDPRASKQKSASAKPEEDKKNTGKASDPKIAAKKRKSSQAAQQSASNDAAYDPFAISALPTLSKIDPLAASINHQETLHETVNLEDKNDDWENEFLHIKAKEINVYRWEDGYAKVDIKKPSLYAGRFKVASLSNAQFSQDPFSEEVEYLGPDIGYDPDYGGAYYGPGWDFRLGNGSLRFSPFVSYGGGNRKRRGPRRFESGASGPGLGGIVHYRADNTRVDLAYNSSVGQPVLYAERALWDKKTRLIASVNEDYVNGFMGFERPGFGVMLADGRKMGEWGNWRLDTFSSLGFFKDDFLPNNQTADFIEFDTSGKDPAMAGRVQFQAQFANKEPLFRVGDWLTGGFRAQVAGAGYTTGDMIGIIRGGPTVNMHYKDRWNTSLRYFISEVTGQSPFFFDQYYYGRQQVGVTNQVKVNDYVTLGINSQISVLRDNASGALFTGNQFFMLVGPKSVKFNIAYDVIRQRSYFGLTFLPGQKGKPVDYDTLRVFSPDDYAPGTTPAAANP